MAWRVADDYAPGIMWSSAEADAFVICLCLPSRRKEEGAGSIENQPQPEEAATMKPGESLRESIGLSRQSPAPVEGEVMGDVHERGEVKSAALPSGLVPTAEERVDWVEAMQSFPTEGRPQVRMISSQMGTTSYAEAVPSSGPGRRGASRRRMGSRRGRGREREEKALVESRQEGILVVTEVRREIVQDPDFLWMCDVEVGSEGEAEANKAEAKAEAAGRRGQAATVPSLDELPLPEGVGILNTYNT